MDTFSRLDGYRAYLETINDGIPIVEETQHRKLEQLAIKDGWDPGEYFAEKRVLEQDFRIWIRTLAAYSAVVLLDSVLETQLHGLAEYIGETRGLKLRVKHMAGKGIERSALYLTLVASVPVKEEPPWSRLSDLQSLRDIIVHRGGKRGESKEHRETFTKLLTKYPHSLTLLETSELRDQVIGVGMDLCRDFARNIEEFFERVFKTAGLPNRHLELEG
jgi:hypothetical protein